MTSTWALLHKNKTSGLLIWVESSCERTVKSLNILLILELSHVNVLKKVFKYFYRTTRQNARRNICFCCAFPPLSSLFRSDIGMHLKPFLEWRAGVQSPLGTGVFEFRFAMALHENDSFSVPSQKKTSMGNCRTPSVELLPSEFSIEMVRMMHFLQPCTKFSLLNIVQVWILCVNCFEVDMKHNSQHICKLRFSFTEKLSFTFTLAFLPYICHSCKSRNKYFLLFVWGTLILVHIQGKQMWKPLLLP